MLRRLVICCALSVLSLCVPAVSAQSPPASRPASAGRAATSSYDVYYRKAGTQTWSEHRSFRTHAEAESAAKQLYQRGFEVQVHTRVTMTHVPQRPKTGLLPESETVTPQQAINVFRMLASQRDIAFHYPADGCYARAHLMIKRMQKNGLKPYKVWTFQNGDPLYVRTTYHPAGHVEWRYHVAPLLRVRLANGQQRWCVIDPALFQSPVTITKWRDAQKKPGSRYTPYVTVTKLGQSPKDAHGNRMAGTGYWPGADPREGADAHAVKMMRMYKPYEGRTMPKTVAVLDLTRPDAVPFRREGAALMLAA
jgi:hypothetical protein